MTRASAGVWCECAQKGAGLVGISCEWAFKVMRIDGDGMSTNKACPGPQSIQIAKEDEKHR
jgi:hypothetical protein